MGGGGGGENMIANARGKEGEANQTLDVLYRWQGGGTKSSETRSSERSVSRIKQIYPRGVPACFLSPTEAARDKDSISE